MVKPNHTEEAMTAAKAIEVLRSAAEENAAVNEIYFARACFAGVAALEREPELHAENERLRILLNMLMLRGWR